MVRLSWHRLWRGRVADAGTFVAGSSMPSINVRFEG